MHHTISGFCFEKHYRRIMPCSDDVVVFTHSFHFSSPPSFLNLHLLFRSRNTLHSNPFIRSGFFSLFMLTRRLAVVVVLDDDCLIVFSFASMLPQKTQWHFMLGTHLEQPNHFVLYYYRLPSCPDFVPTLPMAQQKD